jgi:hypothetical protein
VVLEEEVTSAPACVAWLRFVLFVVLLRKGSLGLRQCRALVLAVAPSRHSERTGRADDILDMEPGWTRM